jgi:hypothetical protein
MTLANINIAKLKKKYKDLYLYYHDNGQWILLKKKPPEDTYYEDPEYQKLLICEGGSNDYGYIPDIVAALCAALEIEVETA